ncbi:MAG: PspC domain-containing protein, partial [Flavobacteriales bacterium]|nr:PspC domain-containing protein [Flavobacteriales bacterium]
MKKTLTANISGAVFHIEEQAYERLNRYLDTIRAQFAGNAGRDEIMTDIESRIAELLSERLGSGRQVVTVEDVDHVIQVMGQPEDYLGEDTFTDGPEGAFHQSSGQARRHRRLFRDPDDKWVGGVLSGVANYFGFDPLILRIIYLVLLITG